jgi:hypothetical protein
MTSRSIVVLFVLGIIAALGVAQAPESRGKKPKVDVAAAGHAEAVKAIKAALTELAAWCESKKLDRERARTLELILVFDENDAAAREGLGYSKGKAGAWERGPKWKEPSNRDNESLGDFKKKRAEVGGVFLDAMAKLLDEERRDIDPGLRARIIGDMSAIDPNDPRTKRSAGEEQAGGKWVLAETARVPARRKQIAALAAASIKAAGTPKPEEPTSEETRLDIKWAAILSTENTRVLGNGSKEEVQKAAVSTEAAYGLFHKVFGFEDVPTGYPTIYYLLADVGAKANLLRLDRRMTAEKRSDSEKLGGIWVDSMTHASWAADAVARLDSSVRQMNSKLLAKYFGITGQHGALHEGVGMHLSWYVTGTRVTWFVGKRKYAQSGGDGLENKLRSGEADWFSEGLALMNGKERPVLRAVLSHHLNDLATDDMLYSYMLGVWLIDGQRPEDVARFLATFTRKGADDAARAAFGVDLNGLEERFVRWAKESRGGGGAK